MAGSKVLFTAALLAAAIFLVFVAGPHAGLTQMSVFSNGLVQRLATPPAHSQRTHVMLNSGHRLPLLGWGASDTKGQNTIESVQAAVEAGYTHIDGAEMYGNEKDLGKGLQNLYKSGKVKREDLYLVSKVGNDHHARDAVLKAAKNSLAQLQEDYLDLYHLHWPNSQEPGPTVQPPFNETWAAMEELVDQGLVKSIGLSNFSPEKIQDILKTARIRPAVNQIEIHSFFRNERALRWCQKEGIHVTAYAPLSSPAKMAKQGKKVPNLLKDENVIDIAKRNKKTPAQVLLRWGIQHGTSVIPKSGNVKHIQENIKDLWSWELSKEDYDTLDSKKYQKKYFEGAFVMNPEGPYRNYEELWNEPEP